MRIAILGSSGSGKSTLARRVAERTGWRHIEIDALYHLSGWQPQDREVLRSQVSDEIAGEHWVCDGNYNSLVGDLVQPAAQVIVVYDLPRRTVVRQVVWRTVRRAVTRTELWNGNRERLANFIRWHPEDNIILWSWTNHTRYRDRHRELAEAGAWDHAEVVWIRSHTDADRWLAGLPPTPRSSLT